MNDADPNADNPIKDPNEKELNQSTKVDELLDVGEEEEAPSKYHRILENFSQLGNLFTRDDWIDILTHSRGSYEDKLRGRRR